MAKIFTLILSIGIALQAWAQVEPEFRVRQETYRPLNNATLLTDPSVTGGFWEAPECFTHILNEPVIFNQFNSVYTEIDICTDGLVELYGDDGEVSVTLVPFLLDLIDKRIDEELMETSDIYVQYQNGYTTIEYRNVASYFEFGWYGSVSSSFNYQIRIEHSTGNILYHYGPSSYEEPLWDLIELLESPTAGVGVFSDNDELYWLLTGNPNNLELTYYENPAGPLPEDRLQQFPNENTLVEIIWEPSTSVKNLPNPVGLTVFPNPVSEELTLEFKGGASNISITDILGKTVFQMENVVSGQTIVLPSMNSGIYIVSLNNELGKHSCKVLKK
jgi:hypothetical protein